LVFRRSISLLAFADKALGRSLHLRAGHAAKALANIARFNAARIAVGIGLDVVISSAHAALSAVPEAGVCLGGSVRLRVFGIAGGSAVSRLSAVHILILDHAL
jgi:hypothetical protein